MSMGGARLEPHEIKALCGALIALYNDEEDPFRCGRLDNWWTELDAHVRDKQDKGKLSRDNLSWLNRDAAKLVSALRNATVKSRLRIHGYSVKISEDYTLDGKADSRNPYVTLEHDPKRERGAWQYQEPKEGGPDNE
jgi:hypothetical protein